MAIKALRSASALALLIGTSGVSGAFAQQSTTPAPTPQAPNQTVRTATPAQQAPQAAAQADQPATADQAAPTDRVIITGSLIATTPEDAPKPVEVYTEEDLKEQGSPSVSEFVRSLSVSYGDDLGFGQSTAEVPTGSGFANANLRGLGSSGTLVLMNGRRTAAANGGFGADLNTVPIEALSAVEVLKDGASATYGAGAVGGVINFRTRRDIDAPQFTVEKRFYDGSDGSYKIDFLDGWAGDNSNFLLSLSHSHEDPMLASARDFSSLPFALNPPSSSLTAANPGRFLTSTNFLTVGTGTPAVTTTFGSPRDDYRTAADCTAIGGVIANVAQPGAIVQQAATLPLGLPNTGCGFSQAPFQDLVSEDNNDRVYAEFNGDLTETMEFHADVSYSKNETFFQQIPYAGPANRSTDAGISTSASTCGTTAFNCDYVIPVQVNTYTTTATGGTPTATFVRNPFIDDFMTRTGITAATLPNTGALYTSNNWRPTLFGGDPLSGTGLRRERYHREQLIINAGLKGKFSEGGMFGLLDGIGYDYNAQYSQYRQQNQNPDISVARLQSALLGYGGPNCNAVDRVPTDFTSAASFNRTVGVQSEVAPGTAGCQWFNPFASSFATSVANGAANPQFNSGAIAGRPSGYQNPNDLWDWLQVDKTTEDTYESGTFDATFTGEIPDTLFTLPGGPIGWAAGGQWRMIERRSFLANDDNPAEEVMAMQECPYPDPAVVNSPAQPNQDVGQRGCIATSSAFFGSGKANITVRNVPAYSDSQLLAFYGEAQFPVLDNLNFSINVRREDFNSGALTGDIWGVAGKWDITDNLYLRSSYSTNYRAEAALDLDPNTIAFSTPTIGRFGNIQRLETVRIASDIGPEDDTNFNAGVGYERDLFDGRIRASVDFFEININGQLATTPQATILTNVFGVNSTTAATVDSQSNRTNPLIPDTATSNSAGQFADCQARLISFVAFATPCVTGVTTANDIAEVKRFQLNGPYFITNGIDYSIDYSHPLFDGTVAAQLTLTQNLHYKQGGYDVNGILFDLGGPRLGLTNLGTGGLAAASTEWKGNAVVRWANDTHNISLRANYDHGSLDERFAAGQLTAIVVDNPATTTINETVYSTYGVNRKSSLLFDATYIYTAPFWQDLELRASVINIFDKNPTPLQVRSGYYNGTADPRGRMIEVGVTKKF